MTIKWWCQQWHRGKAESIFDCEKDIIFIGEEDIPTDGSEESISVGLAESISDGETLSMEIVVVSADRDRVDRQGLCRLDPCW